MEAIGKAIGKGIAAASEVIREADEHWGQTAPLIPQSAAPEAALRER